MNHIVTEAMVCSSNINSSYIRKLKKKKKTCQKLPMATRIMLCYLCLR